MLFFTGLLSWLVSAQVVGEPSIFRLEPEQIQKIAFDLEQVPTEHRQCLYGIERGGLVGILPPHTISTKDLSRFVIPLQDTSLIEVGDILVSFRRQVSESDLFESLLEGSTHARIVFQRPGHSLGHLDAPQRSSQSEGFPNQLFHVIRLRKYPKELGHNFDGNPRSEDDRQKMTEWTQKRTAILARVNELAVKLYGIGFCYDANLRTEVFCTTSKAALIAGLDASTPTCDISFYCSELPTTLYILAGIESLHPPDRMPLLDRIDRDYVSKVQASRPDLSRREIYSYALNALLDEFDMDRQRIREVKGQFLPVLDASPEERKKILATEEGQRALSFISPLDLIHAVYDPQGDFSYVGSFVGGNFSAMNPSKK